MKKLTLWLIAFLLSASIALAQPSGPGALVSEVDGTPNAFVTRIIFPNGTLTIANGAATYNGVGAAETDPVAGAINGIVLGDGAGNLSAAISGTHYLTPLAIALLYMDINYLDGSSDAAQYARFYDGDSNYVQLDLGDFSSDITLYLPERDGETLATTAQIIGSAETYGSGWNSDTGIPQKNDFYDYAHLFDTNDNGDLGDEARNISVSTWEWQDDKQLLFGNDSDLKMRWYVSATDAQEIQNTWMIVNSSDTFEFGYNPSSNDFMVAATAVPAIGWYCSGVTTSETTLDLIRADQLAAQMYADIQTATEDLWDYDFYLQVRQGGTLTTIWMFDESDDQIESTKDFYTTGNIAGGSLTPVTGDADTFAASFTGKNLYGGTFLANGAGTAQLPAVTVGMNFTIITYGAYAVVVEPNASDRFIMDGVLLDDADSATNLSTAGDIAVFQYYSADGWVVTTNGWTDED